MDRDRMRRRVEREVEEELAFHMEMCVRELMERGWTEDEARAEAERRLGDVERVQPACDAKGNDGRSSWDGGSGGTSGCRTCASRCGSCERPRASPWWRS